MERGLWKKKYMWMMSGQEIRRWRREQEDVSPDTGLPRHTERVLRYPTRCRGARGPSGVRTTSKGRE